MHAVILGNGVTGVSAALRLRKLHPNWKITIVSGESKYHYSRPALMYIFMGHMRYEDTKPFEDSYWAEQRLTLVRAWVTKIDTDAKQLELHGQAPIKYDQLLIATGSKPNKFGWPGQDLSGVQGLWDLLDLKRLYETAERTRKAVIVGGGLIGIELAEMLHSRGIHVSFLVREKSYWNGILPNEESDMINREIRAHGIELLLNTELDEILDDGKGRCRGIKTKAGAEMECQLVGLTAGVSPNIAVTAGSNIETGRGILVNSQLQTSAKDVYAAGDCAEIRAEGEERNTIQQVWYTGKMQGEFAARSMAGEKVGKYDAGIWFNSAKFLDLEYHTYGLVHRKVPGEQNLYWEHPNGKHALRIVHTDAGVIGLNTMGLRWRHEVCERWLRDQVSVEHVLDRLEEAYFEPELYKRHESEIRRALRVTV
ncbi:MAG: NADPH-dependent 2,4-dienoyl-CoA reductase/sulfur reductase-like enzyme [Planctomycetota bacterium]|jgi:NADPH-dependent 2,4-dienoyl-CoA reductase/sulfur reductase-like enzyme